MLAHYLKVAIRNLLKYKTQSLVSLLGLAIGLATFSLSGMWLNYNLTYDTHWPESDQIYYVLEKDDYDTQYSEYSVLPLADYIKEHFPEVGESGRLGWLNYLEHEGKEFKITGVDSCILRMFPIQILQGTPDFYRQPKQYAISESTALTLYGTTNVIGCELKNEDKVLGTIVAVFQDVAGHSNFSWDILTANLPVEPFKFTVKDGTERIIPVWNMTTAQTIVRFHKGADIEEFMEKLSASVKKDHQRNKSFRCLLLKDFRNREGQFHKIQLQHIRIFCLMGGLIVLAAILNYLILYAIRIRMRVREMTLRKVHGASKANLTALLMTELVVLMACTYPVGMLILELVLPDFRELSEIKETLGFFYKKGTFFMLLIMAVSLLLSLIIIHTQCRKTLQAGLRKDNLFLMRKVCLGIQLVISIGFIFCSVVMYKQLNHLQHSADTGFKNTEIGFVHNHLAGAGPKEYEEIYRHMQQIPYIQAHAIYEMPFNSGSFYPVTNWEGKPSNAPEIQFYRSFIDQDIFDLFGLQLLVGTIPDKGDTSGKIILNESAVKALGWRMEEVLDKKLEGHEIAGVIKNLNLSPMEPVLPTLYLTSWDKKEIKSIVFTYNGDFKEVQKKLTDYFNERCPHFYYAVETPAIWIEHNLVSEKALLKLLVVASTVSVLISLFGIFSLVNLSCERRRKEMALRKIHGATLKDITMLFAIEYISILMLSSIVAFTVGYALMKPWLEKYVIQTDIPAWLYMAIFMVVLLLITACIGYRVWKAANENPAEVIKSE